MATRQQRAVWAFVALAVLLAVGYVEWRISRAAEVAPAREPAGVASRQASARGSNIDRRAFALAAAANTRAQRAEQAALDLKESLAGREVSDIPEDSSESSGESMQGSDPEMQRAQREEFLKELDERFTAEPVDPAWRVEKESALRNAAAVLNGSGLALEGAECASSMCKVTLAHPSHRGPPRGAIIEFLKAVHAEGSGLTQLAFNFKYEEGATVLYGTSELSEEGESELQ
jgi:hypothetical protein